MLQTDGRTDRQAHYYIDSWYFNCRSYFYLLDVRQGFFEEVEDHILLVGAKLFGHDWARISHFIPSRTPMQIHSRFNTFLKANFENWTQEEDLKLLGIVRKRGTKEWKVIANDFKNRTRSQCRQRFYYIHKVKWSWAKWANAGYTLISMENVLLTRSKKKHTYLCTKVFTPFAKIYTFTDFFQIFWLYIGSSSVAYYLYKY